MAFGQHLDRCRYRSEGRGTRSISDEVRAAQIKHIRHAPGHDVGQLTRHRVFTCLGQRAVHFSVELIEDAGLHATRQRLESAGSSQPIGKLGVNDTLVGDVVQFAAHRRAEDDAGVVSVERTVGIARVSQRLSGNTDRPLLTLIHRGCYFGRNTEALPVELKPLHPTPDNRVGLIGRIMVGVVIIRDAPPIGGRLGNTVALVENILPERPRIGRIRQNGTNANNGDGAICSVH